MLFLYGGGGATVAHWVHAPETQFKSDDRTHSEMLTSNKKRMAGYVPAACSSILYFGGIL